MDDVVQESFLRAFVPACSCESSGGPDTRQSRTERAAVSDPDNTIVTIPGGRDWTSDQVTARIPEDSGTIVPGVFLAGPGRIEIRDANLARGA